MINLLIGTTLLLILILMEIVFLKVVKEEEIPWREVLLNINSGHILLWINRGWILLAYYYIWQNLGFQWIAAWPVWGQWLFTFFAWDFCYYWSHRMHHTVPLLWNVHSIHHQGEHYSLSLGIRNSWFQSLTSFPFFVILSIIGVPIELFIGVSGIHYFIQFYNHNRIVKKSGFLEYFMITPSHHRVHHGSNPEYLNRNHGGTFVFWDKLFGTFQVERDDITIRYGMKNNVHTYHPFWANIQPFLAYFGFQKRNSTPIEAIQYPGWYLLLGGIVLFCLLLCFIDLEPTMTNIQWAFLFLFIFSGTLALGGVAQGQKEGIWVYIGLAVLGGISLVAWNSAEQLLLQINLIAFFLHSIVGLMVSFNTLSKYR